MSLWAFPRWNHEIQESIPIGINSWRLVQLVSKFWRSYFNWYWWIIFQCGISRNISSIGMSKWQQELEMDSQPRSSTSLGNLYEGHDEERWAYMKPFYVKKCQAHQITKFKRSCSWWRLWGLEQRYIAPWTLVLPLCI